MNRKPSEGEREAPLGPDLRDEPAVRERLERIQRDNRARVRWKLSRHTAERALVAITEAAMPTKYRRSGKSRRCKRHKRLL